MTAADERRLVLFEVGGGAYALPIADVLEVTEWSQLAAIPTLPAAVAGVINHHGDALPIVARDALLEEPATETRPEHVLVLGVSGGQSGRLGVPVDRVLGLVDVPAGTPASDGLVVERRPLRGRIVAVLDAARLLERAERVIEQVGGKV
ncbi:MAG: chemotaxis protein CheW [Deltaproteobacteria bacterium]|nr:chemotaxis protein CheW [Deltaproteobacteria bacterium]